MADEYSISAKITADSSQFESSVKSASKSLGGFSSSLSTVGKTLGTLFAVGTVAQMAKGLAQVSQEFSKATANIVKGTGATGDALEELSKSINTALVNGVGRSADEVGQMIADLNTRFGATGKELDTLVAKFDDFASVTDTDVNTAIQSNADLMAKWNIETEQADELLDQLVVASQSSGASVTELSSALVKGQSVFSQFGMSMTDSLALLSALKKNGIDSSVALTGLRTALSNFAKNGDDVQEAFERVAENIKNASTQSEALQISIDAFGSRSGAEMLKVFQSGTESIDEFKTALLNAGGALERTDEASRTAKDAFDDLKATAKGVFFSGGASNDLRDTIDAISKALRTIDFSDLQESFKTLELFIKGSWTQFKELFSLISGNLNSVGDNFSLFADNLYYSLNYLYQNFQNFTNLVSALLNGDFTTAWDNLKLIVLNTVKAIIDSINSAVASMPNLFNSAIEGYNKILEAQDKFLIEFLHLPEKYFKSAKLPTYDGSDLIDTKGLEQSIDALVQKIKDESGQTANATLKDLQKVEKQTKSGTKEIEGEISDLGDTAQKTSAKTEKTVSKTLTNIAESFIEVTDDVIEDANSWTDTINTTKDALGEIATSAMEELGEALVTGSADWAEFGSVAMEALAGVLEGIAGQLSAMAVASAVTHDYADAMIAMAGAAAALVVAGSMRALASQSATIAENLSDSVESLEEFKERLTTILTSTDSIPAIFTTIDEIKSEITDLYDDLLKATEKPLPEYGGGGLLAQLAALAEAVSLINDKISVAYEKLHSVFTSYNNTLRTTISQNKDAAESYRKLFSEMNNNDVYRSILENTQIVSMSSELASIYDSLTRSGMKIGEKLIDSIVEGADKADFLKSMRDYIKESVIQLVVYTDTMQAKLAEIGTKMSQAIILGLDVSEIRAELEALWNEVSASAEKATEIIDSVFGDLADDVEDTLTSLEQKIESFTDSLEDLGGDIADNLINGLADGLSDGDFLETMYTYIRKLIIQTVVYTESMKAEIESIGKTISEGLSNGFSDTTLHEIRRDLSYIFYSANQQMSGIDELLSSVFGGYATGTDNATRGLHIVGEAGPELVSFRGGEKVFNADETRAILSGGSSNSWNITFNNTSDTSAFEMMNQLRMYNREMALNAVI